MPCVGSSTMGKLKGGHDPSSSCQLFGFDVLIGRGWNLLSHLLCKFWGWQWWNGCSIFCAIFGVGNGGMVAPSFVQFLGLAMVEWLRHLLLGFLGVAMMMQGLKLALLCLQPPRLTYLIGTFAKVRILENVQTGEIGMLTEQTLGSDWHVRKITTNPSASWIGYSCVLEFNPLKQCTVVALTVYSIVMFLYHWLVPPLGLSTVYTCKGFLWRALRIAVSHAQLASGNGMWLCTRIGVHSAETHLRSMRSWFLPPITWRLIPPMLSGWLTMQFPKRTRNWSRNGQLSKTRCTYLSFYVLFSVMTSSSQQVMFEKPTNL